MHRPRIRLHQLASVGLALSLALALAVVPDTASACSCEMPSPPSEALADADAVFLGEVVDLRRDGAEVTGDLIARIAVEEVWKGEVAEVVEVRTALDGATCGYSFTAGGRDLVYARHSDDGGFSTNLCTRSAPADAADEDLTAFGAGEAPIAGEQLAARQPSWLTLTAAMLTVGLALALIVGGILWRRRGRAG